MVYVVLRPPACLPVASRHCRVCALGSPQPALPPPFTAAAFRWGNTLSTKMFLAKKFVLKHIRTKFEAKVQEERDKVCGWGVRGREKDEERDKVWAEGVKGGGGRGGGLKGAAFDTAGMRGRLWPSCHSTHVWTSFTWHATCFMCTSEPRYPKLCERHQMVWTL